MVEQLTRDQTFIGRSAKRWRVCEARKVFESGLLDGTQYELLNGEIFEKMPKGVEHGDAVIVLLETLGNIFGFRHLQTQRQINIGERDEFNDPEPDIAVLKNPLRSYRNGGIVPQEDVLVAIEVAKSYLPDDLGFKAQIYARNGVREYWVANIEARTLHVHRQPSEIGYELVRVLRPGDMVSPPAAPDAVLSVSELLPVGDQEPAVL